MANNGAAKSKVFSSNPIAIAFATRCENVITSKDKIIKNPNSCKKIIDENLILCFDFA